jgi:hypothetical protein
MGQSIVATEKPSSNPGVVRFETNRALTGMGHERYTAGTEVWGERPPDELARRLLAKPAVAAVQINGNVVTVDLNKGHTSEGLLEIIENLYRFYPDAPEGAPASAEEAPAEEAPAEEAPADDAAAEPAADDAPVTEEPAAAEAAADEAPADEVTEADVDVAADAPEMAAEPAEVTEAEATDAPDPELTEPATAANPAAEAEPES